MDTMASLREATWDAHVQMEKRLAIKDRFSILASYSGHIALLLAFYEPAEAEWAGLLDPALADYRERRKAHLLARDLQAIGGTPIPPSVVPSVTDTASALGAFYVLEGATLGGRHLLPVVERKLGLSATHGASYLASYGTEVADMWRTFAASVESHVQTPDTVGRAIAAARTTFLAMDEWLCGART